MRVTRALAAIVFLCAAAGCGDGALEITPTLDGQSALAVGGTTTLRVERGGSCAEIERAESSDARIARVTEVRGCEFDLEGRAAGRVAIDVRADGASASLDVRTANPHRALIQHTCSEEMTATYVTEQPADLRYRLFDGADNPIWGNIFEVELSDPTLAEVMSVEPGNQRASLAVGGEAGQLTLDPRGSDPAITMKLVSPAALDGLDLGLQSGGEPIEPGESRSTSSALELDVIALEGRRRVCNWGRAGFDLDVTSNTPEVCLVGDTRERAETSQTKTIETGDEPFRIWVVGRGTCELAATLAGQGVGDASGELVFDVNF